MIRVNNEMSPLAKPALTPEQAAAYETYMKLNEGIRRELMELVNYVNGRLWTNYILYTCEGQSVYFDLRDEKELSDGRVLSSEKVPRNRVACFVFVKKDGGLPEAFNRTEYTFPLESGVFYLRDGSVVGSLYFELEDARNIQARLWVAMRAMAYGVGIDWGLPFEFNHALIGGENDGLKLENVDEDIRGTDVAHRLGEGLTGADEATGRGAHDGWPAGETRLFRLPSRFDSRRRGPGWPRR